MSATLPRMVARWPDVKVRDRLAAIAHALEEVHVMIVAHDDPELLRIELLRQKRGRLGGDRAPGDVHPALAADEPAAGLVVQLQVDRPEDA